MTCAPGRSGRTCRRCAADLRQGRPSPWSTIAISIRPSSWRLHSSIGRLSGNIWRRSPAGSPKPAPSGQHRRRSTADRLRGRCAPGRSWLRLGKALQGDADQILDVAWLQVQLEAPASRRVISSRLPTSRFRRRASS